MVKMEIDQINASINGITKAATQFQEFERQHQEMDARRQALERMVVSQQVVTQPVEKLSADAPLKELIDTIKAQNEILSKQVGLLKEENELQKEQVDAAKESEEQARKEALRAWRFNWGTFGITTVISIAALIISIFAK